MIDHEIQAAQRQDLLFMGEVVHAEQTLTPIERLSPEPEQLITQVQGELGCVGVECRLRLTQGNEVLQRLKDSVDPTRCNRARSTTHPAPTGAG